METRADEQGWGPSDSNGASLVILEETVAKTEKDKPDEMLPEIFLVPIRPKRRKTPAATRKTTRKVVFHDSFDFTGESMDGNPLGGTPMD